MANIFQQIEKGYDKTSKIFNNISIIIFILLVGIVLLSNINTPKTNTDNVFNCELSNEDELIIQDKNDLNTVFELSLVNNSLDIFDTKLGKNDVPAIENPNYDSYLKINNCMRNDDIVYTLTIDNITKIYPIKILENHIVINDTFNSTPIVIIYSPLSSIFKAYIREVKEETLVFGVSGKLYKNTDLIFDNRSESLWSIVDGKAIVGTKIGSKLNSIGSISKMSYSESLKIYSDNYLNFKTGFLINYYSNPFGDYRINNSIIQKVTTFDNKIDYKKEVWAFYINDKPFYINPNIEINGLIYSEINIAGEIFNVEYNGESLKVYNNENEINTFPVYWFVWYDIFPSSNEINLI